MHYTTPHFAANLFIQDAIIRVRMRSNDHKFSDSSTSQWSADHLSIPNGKCCVPLKTDMRAHRTTQTTGVVMYVARLPVFVLSFYIPLPIPI